MRSTATPYAAVVLAGGRAVRLDGADKAALEVEGTSLLERALAAVVDAVQVVVVGEPRTTSRPVTFVREQPRHGGPAAALLTGRDALDDPPGHLLVLACDMPHVTAATVTRLRAAGVCHDGAALVGPDGRRQLALLLDVARLDQVRPGPGSQDGMSVHRLLAGLHLDEVPAAGREHRDVDTWTDLADLSP